MEGWSVGRIGFACLVCAGCLVACLVCAGCFAFASRVASEGYRDGEVQKFSRTGLVWKTYEGEMGLAGFRAGRDKRGSTSNTWYFSVTDESVVATLTALRPGAKVRVHYEKRILCLPWVGNTRHFATKVEVSPTDAAR